MNPRRRGTSGSTLRTGLLVVALSLLSIVSVLAIASAVGDDDGDDAGRELATTTAPATTVANESAVVATAATTTTSTTTTTTVAATTPPTEVATSSPQSSVPEPESTPLETTSTTSAPETTEVDAADSDQEDSDDESSDESLPEPSESSGSDDALDYPALPDGSPVPVEAVYEGSVVTLTGLVPSEEAKAQLEALAIAGAPRPDTTAVNLLEINENVPQSVGARVLSLDSVRFPEASSEITPEHAAEIDGVVRTLESLPNVTLLVIGHSDRRGDAASNLRLSQERADAMVFYLASQGIEPSRMSSRAMGESNPISEANSDAALRLNRRTELIFYGLIAG